jgi:hypothetical protein
MVAGRPLGSKNKVQRTEPKYRMTIRNVIDDTESSMNFPTIDSISKYLETKGISMSTNNIRRFIADLRPNPLIGVSFSKLPEKLNDPCGLLK